MTIDDSRALEWTGERYVPEIPGNIRLEHVHRYLLARELTRGQRVLDIACGEGYGSNLLAQTAAHVIGVDIVPSVVEHARRRYRRANLEFLAGNCAAIPIADHAVDVVVSFETLEHLEQHDEMMHDVKRVLRPGGSLVISSPDRRQYSELPGYHNPFHLRELDREEFEQLLKLHFRETKLIGQRIRAGSVIGPLQTSENTIFISFGDPNENDKRAEGLDAPLYLIGVATDGVMPQIPIGLLDGGDFIWSRDQTETVRALLERHRAEIDGFAHGKTALEASVAVLRSELERQTALVMSLSTEKGRSEERSRWLQEEIDRRGRRIDEIEGDRSALEGGMRRWEQHATALEANRNRLAEELSSLQKQIEEAHQAEHARNQELQILAADLAQSRRLAHARGQELEILAAELARSQQELQALGAELGIVRRSHSWRLTAPLRGSRRLVGTMRRRIARLGRANENTAESANEPPEPVAAKVDPESPASTPETTRELRTEADSEPPQNISMTTTPGVDPRKGVPDLQSIAVHEYPARTRPSIVVVSHDAHFYGAQRLMLVLAQTLSEHLNYDVEVLLCGGGPLEREFARVGRVHDLFASTATPEVQDQTIRDLFARGARVALCNTSCVGDVVRRLKAAGFRVASMIHELPGLIGEYGLQESIATIARHADCVVFPAEVVRDRFSELTSLPNDKTVVRPQGLLARNRFGGPDAGARRELRARLGLDEATKIVLAVGSSHLRKGVDLFVDVGLILLKTREDLAFVWVGHKDGDGFAIAEGRVADADRRDRFFFPGVSEDIDPFFSGSDVYLMTSREDPFPSVVLHAFDARLPVIGFQDGGGFVELLQRDCGVLVPYLDTQAMAAATLRLLSDPVEVERLTAAGKAILDREFGFIDYARDLVHFAQGPKVSVIVPNYNYEHYLPSRLRSIMLQSYRPYEIIFLDDCSSDRSVEVAEALLRDSGIPYRILRNDTNQGVYRQWLRGLHEATGDLVWIAEADDECAPVLLETLVPAFSSPDVVLAYTQSKQIDEEGREIAPDYLQWTADVSPTKWREVYIRRGTEEVRDSLAVKNTIPNVSAVLMRKPDLSGIESQLVGLRNAGDWMMYVHLLERGDVAFFPQSVNYHRRHSGSVTIGHGGLNLMRETLLVQRHVLDRHQIAPDVERKREAHLQATYEYLGLHTDGSASYKEHEALKPLIVFAG